MDLGFKQPRKAPYSTTSQPLRGELRDASMKRNLAAMVVIHRKFPQSVNQVFPFGITMLHQCCRQGDRAITEWLLLKEAHVDPR